MILIGGYFQNEEDNEAVIPIKSIELKIPLNATLDNVELTFNEPVTETNIHLPFYKYIPPGGDGYSSYEYSDISDDYGQVPSQRYTYNVSQSEGCQVLTIAFCPILYDPAANTAQIFKSITIGYTLTSPSNGVLESFSPEKRTYSVGETITTQSLITNTSDASVSYNITLNISSLGGTQIATASGNVTIESGKSETALVSIDAPLQDGVYKLEAVVSDGQNVIGQLYEMISVVSGIIINFQAPESIIKGSYGTFTVLFQNVSGAEADAYIDIYVYDNTGKQAAKLPSMVEKIAAGETKTVSTQWFPPDSLVSGSYYGHMVASIGDAEFKRSSESFLITGVDNCPNDPNKTEPGICGCGVADTDTDADGTPDCNDNCPTDPNKTEPGICGCGIADIDGCGVAPVDNCPDDPNKTEPGICGCGVADTDTDADGTADCNDNCPTDPNKTQPGLCGCNAVDIAGCGVPQPVDNCPDDPNKTEPGICGCGVTDTDTDADGTADCNDNCPNDPNKTEPGICGCGNPENFNDDDSTCFISSSGYGF